MSSLLLLDWALKSSLVISMAWAAVKLTRHGAKFRRLVWVCAFVAVLLVPLANALLAKRAQPVLVGVASQPNPGPAPVDYTLAFWLFGVGAGALWLGAGYAGLWLSLRNARSKARWQLSDDKGRPIRVQVTDSAGPLTFGILRPAILLPEAAKTWSQDQLRAVMLHELGHIRNFDSLVLLLANSVCIVLWFNPLLWLALRALRSECEAAADEAVVDSGIKPSAYASVLLSLVAGMGRRRSPSAALSMVRTPAIEHRIRAIVAAKASRRLTSAHRLGTLVTCLICVLAAGSLRLATAQPAGPSEEWQRGYELGQAYKAGLRAGGRSEGTSMTDEERREIERHLSQNLGPPGG